MYIESVLGPCVFCIRGIWLGTASAVDSQVKRGRGNSDRMELSAQTDCEAVTWVFGLSYLKLPNPTFL